MYVFSFAEEVKGWQCPRWLSWMGKLSRYLAPWFVLFKNKGVQIALLVAVCGAVSINFDKLSALRSSVTFAPACILLFCGVVGFIKTIQTKEWIQVERRHLVNLFINPVVFAMVLICYWAAFINYSLVAYVGAFKRITLIFALVLAMIVLKEKGALKRWPGAVVMAVGAPLY